MFRVRVEVASLFDSLSLRALSMRMPSSSFSRLQRAILGRQRMGRGEMERGQDSEGECTSRSAAAIRIKIFVQFLTNFSWTTQHQD